MSQRRVLNRFFIMVIMLVGSVLSGCSSKPVYKTYYTHIPPASTVGRTCVNTCESNRLLCEQRIDSQYDRCQRNADKELRYCQDNKRRDYDRCISNLKRQHGNYWHKYESNCYYHNPNQCRLNSCYRRGNCDSSYNRCFKGCGGKIKSDTRCVRNCDKKPK